MKPQNSSAGPGSSRDQGSFSRRDVFMWIAATGGVLGTLLASVPVIGTLLTPILRKRQDEWVDVGEVDEFPKGQMRLIKELNPLRHEWDGAAGKVGAYVRRTESGEFNVFSTICAHLGCPVTWFEQSGLFMCPCHGGVYYADGSRAAGPPPRGLYQLPHRVRSNRLQVQLGHQPTLATPA